MHQDVVMMHLLHKRFMEDYLCWYAHGELFVCNESMGETIVGSTSSASNVHKVANDNNNPYMNMIMNAMIIITQILQNLIYNLTFIENQHLYIFN